MSAGSVAMGSDGQRERNQKRKRCERALAVDCDDVVCKKPRLNSQSEQATRAAMF